MNLVLIIKMYSCKKIAKLTIFFLLVVSFIGCEKNLESCAKSEFKKYAKENQIDASLISIEPIDTVFAEKLINKAHEALAYHSEVQRITDKLVRWIKSSDYSIRKMGYDGFTKTSDNINVFIEAKNMCSVSKKWLEEALFEA